MEFVELLRSLTVSLETIPAMKIVFYPHPVAGATPLSLRERGWG